MTTLKMFVSDNRRVQLRREPHRHRNMVNGRLGDPGTGAPDPAEEVGRSITYQTLWYLIDPIVVISGIRTRRRTCDDPSPMDGGAECPGCGFQVRRTLRNCFTCVSLNQEDKITALFLVFVDRRLQHASMRGRETVFGNDTVASDKHNDVECWLYGETIPFHLSRSDQRSFGTSYSNDEGRTILQF